MATTHAQVDSRQSLIRIWKSLKMERSGSFVRTLGAYCLCIALIAGLFGGCAPFKTSAFHLHSSLANYKKTNSRPKPEILPGGFEEFKVGALVSAGWKVNPRFAEYVDSQVYLIQVSVEHSEKNALALNEALPVVTWVKITYKPQTSFHEKVALLRRVRTIETEPGLIYDFGRLCIEGDTKTINVEFAAIIEETIGGSSAPDRRIYSCELGRYDKLEWKFNSL